MHRRPVGILTLGLSLVVAGCPPPGGTYTKAAPPPTGIELGVFQANAPHRVEKGDQATHVGSSVRLQLLLTSGPGQYTFGALTDTDSTGKKAAQWHAEPQDAVEFEANPAKVRFLKTGKIKIWATYRKGGSAFTSNELKFTAQ